MYRREFKRKHNRPNDRDQVNVVEWCLVYDRAPYLYCKSLELFFFHHLIHVCFSEHVKLPNTAQSIRESSHLTSPHDTKSLTHTRFNECASKKRHTCQ